MAKRGTRPKPTALKILEGCRADRINDAEPAYPVGSCVPPDWLAGHALELWNELAPQLAASGVLAVVDRTALALLCDDYRRVRSDPDDSKARDRVHRKLSEFGLTPSSRSQVKAPAGKPKDDLEAFLEQKKA